MKENNELEGVQKVLEQIYKSCSKIEKWVVDDSAIHKEAVTALKYTGVLLKACGGKIPTSTDTEVSVKKPIFRVVSKKG